MKRLYPTSSINYLAVLSYKFEGIDLSKYKVSAKMKFYKKEASVEEIHISFANNIVRVTVNPFKLTKKDGPIKIFITLTAADGKTKSYTDKIIFEQNKPKEDKKRGKKK